jgi:hypothetical protein
LAIPVVRDILEVLGHRGHKVIQAAKVIRVVWVTLAVSVHKGHRAMPAVRDLQAVKVTQGQPVQHLGQPVHRAMQAV